MEPGVEERKTVQENRVGAAILVRAAFVVVDDVGNVRIGYQTRSDCHPTLKARRRADLGSSQWKVTRRKTKLPMSQERRRAKRRTLGAKKRACRRRVGLC